MIAFFLIFLLLFLTAAEKIIYKKLWKKGLTAEIEFDKKEVYEGDINYIKIQVSNRKSLPLNVLNVKFNTHKSLKFKNEENLSTSDMNNKQDMFSVTGYEKITRSLEIKCSKRGIFSIDEVDLVTRDYLMLKDFVERKEVYTELTVYPRAINPAKINNALKQINGEIASERFSFDNSFDIKNIREYTPSDPLKSINHTASAKAEDFMVNVFENTSDVKVNVLLNLDNYTGLDETALKEESIRITAGVCESFIKQGIPTGFVTNGVSSVTGKKAAVMKGCGSSHAHSIRYALSGIDEKKLLFKGKQLKDFAGDSYNVVISANVNKEIVSAFEGMEKTYFIVPYDIKGEKPDVKIKNAFFWEVQS